MHNASISLQHACLLPSYFITNTGATVFIGSYDALLQYSLFHIKTHDSESRGQEEAAVRDE